MAIHGADMVVLRPGSLFTEYLTYLMMCDLGQASIELQKAEVCLYLAIFMNPKFGARQKSFTDSDHVTVLHKTF